MTDTADWLPSPQRIQPSATVTQNAAVGATSVLVDDSSSFRPGDTLFAFLAGFGFVVESVGANEIVPTPALVRAINAGDTLTLIPTVGVYALPDPQLTPVIPPIKLTANVFVNFATTGINHIIPGVPSGNITLWSINVEFSAAGAFAGTWQDTQGNQVGITTLQNGTPRLYRYDRRHLPGGAGAGLDFNVTVAGASAMEGFVTYTVE